MEKLILFLKIIAWCGAVASTILMALSTYAAFTYPGSIDETLDKLRGIQRSYPVLRWLIMAIICWAFIIAF